jgi:hypothetical protein
MMSSTLQRQLTRLVALLVLGASSTTGYAQGKEGGDWGAFYASLRVVTIQTNAQVTLNEGQAIRFKGALNAWCGEKNTGIQIISGNGNLLDKSPMATARGMNRSGNYGSVNIAPVKSTSFFVASYTPTVIKLLVTDWKTLGQDCGGM